MVRKYEYSSGRKHSWATKDTSQIRLKGHGPHLPLTFGHTAIEKKIMILQWEVEENYYSINYGGALMVTNLALCVIYTRRITLKWIVKVQKKM